MQTSGLRTLAGMYIDSHGCTPHQTCCCFFNPIVYTHLLLGLQLPSQGGFIRGKTLCARSPYPCLLVYSARFRTLCPVASSITRVTNPGSLSVNLMGMGGWGSVEVGCAQAAQQCAPAIKQANEKRNDFLGMNLHFQCVERSRKRRRIDGLEPNESWAKTCDLCSLLAILVATPAGP